MKKLSQEYYQKDALTLAQDLMGKILCHKTAQGILMGRIVETEAYLENDKACHGYKGKKTQRTGPLFLPGGHIYTYFTYGIHTLFNIVSGPENQAEAVLIRSLLPIQGEEIFYQNRYQVKKEEATSYQRKNLLNGPAKLTQAMEISLEDNTKDLQGDIYLLDDGYRSDLKATKRIGIDYAEEAVDYPYRFIFK